MKPSRLPHEKKISILKTWLFVVSVKKKKHAQHLNLHDTFEVNTQYSVIYIQVFFASP